MTASHTLATEGLTLGYGDRAVIEGLDLTPAAGRITVIVGANAYGRSTLLRPMSRLLVPRTGRVVLDGRAVHRTPAKDPVPGRPLVLPIGRHHSTAAGSR